MRMLCLLACSGLGRAQIMDVRECGDDPWGVKRGRHGWKGQARDACWEGEEG